MFLYCSTLLVEYLFRILYCVSLLGPLYNVPLLIRKYFFGLYSFRNSSISLVVSFELFTVSTIGPLLVSFYWLLSCRPIFGPKFCTFI